MSDEARTLVVRLKAKAMDDIPLGVLRLSLDDNLTYMNRAARELAGPGVGIGSPLKALRLAADSERMLSAEIIERRRTERGGSYPMTLQRPDLGTEVHVNVSAVPEYGADGGLVGSVGFITDVTMQRAHLAIHEAIGVACDWHALLQAVDLKMREVLAFDSIVVSLVSADHSALRVFYEYPARTVQSGPAWRWWPMPAFVRADLDALLVTRADDLLQMFQTAPYRDLAASDRATAEWLTIGYKHMLRRPVMRHGRLVAIVSLFRLANQPFSVIDVDRVDQLPVVEAVNMALALDHQKELAFGLELIGRLGAVAGSIAKVGQVLVDGIRDNFDWEHVSLFRVSADEGTITLVYQAATSDGRLDDHYAQSMQWGLLGHVARSGQSVRLDDVRTSAVYLEGIAGTLSEMCLPVPGQPVRWILNVESKLRSAFSAEEQQAVERLLEVAGLILDRTLALEFNATVLDSVADAIIQTTSRGEIQNVNPACEKLLDRTRESLIGKHLTTLISAPGQEPDPPGFATRLVGMAKLLPGEVELIPRDGPPIPVLLSGESLPPQIGGKVYVASDLRFRQAVQRMDSLQHVFRQVASEIRLPLALMSSYLAELTDRNLGAEDAERTFEKAMRQLHRADLPLERVVRLAALGEGQDLPLQAVLLPAFADALVTELPRAHARLITVESDPSMPAVLAARQELEFCAASLLAFVLRMKAQRDHVRIRIRRDQSQQVLVVELVDADTQARSATRLQAKSDYEREFALAEPVIRALMQRMRGSFEVQQRDGISLRLALPEAA